MGSLSWLANYSGIAAVIWMLLGVALVARMIPGYSHCLNFMSELGARGRPSAAIHPFVNNLPIGLLFFLYGLSLYLNSGGHSAFHILGILMILHGISHWFTGLFPCDEDMGLANPSSSQVMHNLAGLVMLLTLLIACVVGAVSDALFPGWFRTYSLASAVSAVLLAVFMAKPPGNRAAPGLYQRLSYGALALWVVVLNVWFLDNLA